MSESDGKFESGLLGPVAEAEVKYTAVGGAWRRFLWTFLWGAIASATTYALANFDELFGFLSGQVWWPVIVPLVTALLAAISKWAIEKQRGH